MNADERMPGQQGYGEDTAQTSDELNKASTEQQPSAERQGQSLEVSQSQGGSMATGQASYGNSGDTGTMNQQGQGSSPEQSGDGLFRGSNDDMGSLQAQSSAELGTDGSQDFASDGQGALSADPAGSDGTTDPESERSQNRGSDIEGSSM